MCDYIKREDAVERVAFEVMYEAAIAKRLTYKELFDLEAEKIDRVKLHVQKWLEQVDGAEVVEVSKILKTADEQEKQGFIQTAKVLRELVNNE